MHLSHATLVSLALPLAALGMLLGSPASVAPISNAGSNAGSSAPTAFVAPSEVLELARSKRRFEQEDLGLITRAMHRAGVDQFVIKVDPNSGDVSINTEKDHVAHLDIKPGSCPNPIQLRGANAAATVSTGVLGNAFDVTQVNLGSVRMQRPPPAAFMFDAQVIPIHVTLSDVGTPFHGDSPCDCAAFGPDGILDINVQYNKSDFITVLKLDAETIGSNVPLQVVGISKDAETIFAAVDCVRIQR
jgi:hypothetical protein